MREYILVNLYGLMELLSYCLGYAIFFHARFKKRPMPYLLAGMTFLLMNGAAFLCGQPCYFWHDMFLVCIVIPLFLIRKRKAKWFLLFPPIVIGISSFQIAISFAWGLWSGQTETEVLADRVQLMFCEGVALLLLFAIYLLQRQMKKERKEVHIDRSQYFLFYIGTFCSFVLIGSTQGLIGHEFTDEKVYMLLGLAITLVCITFLILIFWLGIVKGSEAYYREQAQRYETFMKMQEQQIRNVIDADKEMRKYRHDMHGHVAAMRALSEESKNKELSRYLANMEQNVFSGKAKRHTGDTALDAVINQVLEGVDVKEVKVHINTVLPNGKDVIGEYDLCTLVYNLMKNAVEACEKFSGERQIELMMYSYEDKFVLIVRNTVEGEVSIIDNRLQTTKEDKKNHGLGSINVRDVVEQHGGTVEYRCEDGWFEAEIIL